MKQMVFSFFFCDFEKSSFFEKTLQKQVALVFANMSKKDCFILFRELQHALYDLYKSVWYMIQVGALVFAIY